MGRRISGERLGHVELTVVVLDVAGGEDRERERGFGLSTRGDHFGHPLGADLVPSRREFFGRVLDLVDRDLLVPPQLGRDRHAGGHRLGLDPTEPSRHPTIDEHDLVGVVDREPRSSVVGQFDFGEGGEVLRVNFARFKDLVADDRVDLLIHPESVPARIGVHAPQSLRGMNATKETIRVRYGETDMMGHAYYANYLFWFEQARGAWCRDRGFSYLELEAMGYKLPVVEVHARYKAEVTYDQLIEVEIWMSEVRRAAVRFDYRIVNLDTGATATEGHTWHVLMGEARRAVGIPLHVREMLERTPGNVPE